MPSADHNCKYVTKSEIGIKFGICIYSFVNKKELSTTIGLLLPVLTPPSADQLFSPRSMHALWAVFPRDIVLFASFSFFLYF